MVSEMLVAGLLFGPIETVFVLESVHKKAQLSSIICPRG
jgi:hypothetical protein